jgi:hypothetical protein
MQLVILAAGIAASFYLIGKIAKRKGKGKARALALPYMSLLLILSVAFVGWLVFDWVQSRGGNLSSEINPVVGEVGGQEIRYGDWNAYLQNQLQLARQQRGSLMRKTFGSFERKPGATWCHRRSFDRSSSA